MKNGIGFFILALLFVLPADPVEGQPQNVTVKWQSPGADLELARIRQWPSALFSPELLLVRTSLKKYRVGVVRALDFGKRAASVEQMSALSRAVVGINANFFDEHTRPLGLVISNGDFHQDIHKGGNTLTGVFQVGRKGPSIIHRADFSSEKVLEAIQAGPRILTDSKSVTVRATSNDPARRAGVCVDSKGRLIFFISSGMLGISIPDLQNLISLKEVGCKDALNLDGGGSAQFYLSSSILESKEDHEEIVIPGADAVPVMLGLFVR